ncbi:helix-turn-helix transcriptional regulator [Jeotgalibaca porci]
MMTHFSEKIYQLRKEFSYSQEEVAERLQVSRQTISNWENGTAQPALDKAVELSNLFQVSLDELVGKIVGKSKPISPLLSDLVGQTITIFLVPSSDAWISVSRTEVTACEVIAVSEHSLKVIVSEKKQRIERVFMLRDIVGMKQEVV